MGQDFIFGLFYGIIYGYFSVFTITMESASPQPEKKNGGKRFLFIIAIAGLALLGGYLFIGDQLLFQLQQRVDLRSSARGEDEVLTIGYAFAPDHLEPTHFDQIARNYLANIYEGLVRTDRDLNVEPALAVSWGLLDPLTWEFRLRPGATFQNGAPLTADDVVYSIERAARFEESELKDLLNTIQSIEVAENEKILIHTRVPDPLLLNKLAVTFIFPNNYQDFDIPVGTGPYQFVSYEDGKMALKRNAAYWGTAPAFPHVILNSIPDRKERLVALEKGQVQLLGNVPPTAACSRLDNFHHPDECQPINAEDVEIMSIPSLEVSFIIFNVEHELFQSRAAREALTYAFDIHVFEDIAFGFAKGADQFVSSGVFGFNPQIEPREFDMEKAQQLIDSVIGSSFERVSVTFDYPEKLHPVGEYVSLQLTDLGIDVDLNPISDLELQQKIIQGTSDFYFLGWRSELGDASDVLQGMVHSRDRTSGYGLYNGAHYVNKKVDQLIEESQENLDEESRGAQLQEIMKIVTEDDILGVPLFESETIYAVHNGIHFEPRVDGYILASDIW